MEENFLQRTKISQSAHGMILQDGKKTPEGEKIRQDFQSQALHNIISTCWESVNSDVSEH